MTTLQRARLDTVLVERGMAGSRERAQALVAAGLVEVDGVRARSAAVAVAAQAAIRLTDRTHPWVGRGGLKLDAALEGWRIDCAGRTCLDAGASTGGFTDVLLHRDAALVYAVDVGHGQLHPRLAADPRVRVLDRTNIRTLDHLDGPVPSLITLDLSFISLRAVLPGLGRLAPGAEVVALLKFTSGVQEVFAVALLPRRFPDLISEEDKLLESSFVVPTECLGEVAATVRAS